MTDPGFHADIRAGLPALRARWITERNDVEAYQGRTVKPEDNGLKPGGKRTGAEEYPGLRGKPLRAQSGRCVTQMHYARQGIITPEMEFAAIREEWSRNSSGRSWRAAGLFCHRILIIRRVNRC